jgi:hypothetical protein
MKQASSFLGSAGCLRQMRPLLFSAGADWLRCRVEEEAGRSHPLLVALLWEAWELLGLVASFVAATAGARLRKPCPLLFGVRWASSQGCKLPHGQHNHHFAASPLQVFELQKAAPGNSYSSFEFCVRTI